MDHLRRRRLHLAENELLRADADPIAVIELGRFFYGNTVDATAVTTSEVLEDGVSVVDKDTCMPPRDGRVENSDVAIVTSTDERLSRREIEFLQQESQAISRWTVWARVAHSSLRLFLPRINTATQSIRTVVARISERTRSPLILMLFRPSFKHRERKRDDIGTPAVPQKRLQKRGVCALATLVRLCEHHRPTAREAIAARLQAGKKLANKSQSKLENVAATGAACA